MLNLNYLFSDTKRLAKIGIYLIYLYVFGMKFVNMSKYFVSEVISNGKNIISKIFITFLKLQPDNNLN